MNHHQRQQISRCVPCMQPPALTASHEPYAELIAPVFRLSRVPSMFLAMRQTVALSHLWPEHPSPQFHMPEAQNPTQRSSSSKFQHSGSQLKVQLEHLQPRYALTPGTLLWDQSRYNWLGGHGPGCMQGTAELPAAAVASLHGQPAPKGCGQGGWQGYGPAQGGPVIPARQGHRGSFPGEADGCC